MVFFLLRIATQCGHGRESNSKRELVCVDTLMKHTSNKKECVILGWNRKYDFMQLLIDVQWVLLYREADCARNLVTVKMLHSIYQGDREYEKLGCERRLVCAVLYTSVLLGCGWFMFQRAVCKHIQTSAGSQVQAANWHKELVLKVYLLYKVKVLNCIYQCDKCKMIVLKCKYPCDKELKQYECDRKFVCTLLFTALLQGYGGLLQQRTILKSTQGHAGPQI